MSDLLNGQTHAGTEHAIQAAAELVRVEANGQTHAAADHAIQATAELVSVEANWKTGTLVDSGIPYSGGVGQLFPGQYVMIAPNKDKVLQQYNYQNGAWVGPIPMYISAANIPSLALFEGNCHIVFPRLNFQEFLHAVYDNALKTWRWTPIPKLLTPSYIAPSIVTHRGHIYMSYISTSDSRVMYARFDGHTWTDGFATGEKSHDTPALMSIDNRLHCLFSEADGERRVVDLIFDDNRFGASGAWSRNARLDGGGGRPGVKSGNGVTACTHGDYGYLFNCTNEKEHYIQITIYDKATNLWRDWERIGGQRAKNLIPAASFGKNLVVSFITNDDHNRLLYSIGDVQTPPPYLEWMSKVPNIENVPLNRLCLPLVHDCGTYNLSDNFVSEDIRYGIPNILVDVQDNAALSFALSEILRLLGVLMSPRQFINGIVRSTSTTQSGTLAQQLEKGARVLDLRVCYQYNDFYAFHAFTSHDNIAKMMQDVATFLSATKKEVVIVWMDPRGTAMTDVRKTQIRDIVTRILQPYLVQPQNASARVGSLTIGQILNAAPAGPARSRVIIADTSLSTNSGSVWAGQNAAPDGNSGPNPFAYGYYSDTSDPSVVQNPALSNSQPSYYNKWLQTYKAQGSLYPLWWTLTIQPDEINGLVVKRLRTTTIVEKWLIEEFINKYFPQYKEPAFNNVQQLSLGLVPSMASYNQRYTSQLWNSIATDFVEDSATVPVAIDRCRNPRAR